MPKKKQNRFVKSLVLGLGTVALMGLPSILSACGRAFGWWADDHGPAEIAGVLAYGVGGGYLLVGALVDVPKA